AALVDLKKRGKHPARTVGVVPAEVTPPTAVRTLLAPASLEIDSREPAAVLIAIPVLVLILIAIPVLVLVLVAVPVLLLILIAVPALALIGLPSIAGVRRSTEVLRARDSGRTGTKERHTEKQPHHRSTSFHLGFLRGLTPGVVWRY